MISIFMEAVRYCETPVIAYQTIRCLNP